jgi:predicted nucleic acid-binding protein
MKGFRNLLDTNIVSDLIRNPSGLVVQNWLSSRVGTNDVPTRR